MKRKAELDAPEEIVLKNSLISVFRLDVRRSGRSPTLGACTHPIFLSLRFHRRIYFQFEFISSSYPHRNLSDQLQSQARTKFDMSRGRIVLSLAHRAHVDWNWPISREKYLKIDWSAKMPLHWLIMGVVGSQKWAPDAVQEKASELLWVFKPANPGVFYNYVHGAGSISFFTERTLGVYWGDSSSSLCSRSGR